MTQASVLVLDHFDSFTYNLVQCFAELGAKVQVVRTDQPFASVEELRPTHIVLSPGPGHPKDVPMFQQAIGYWQGKLPILGVCLGHQAIAYHLGVPVVRAQHPMHGKTCKVNHYNNTLLFQGVPSEFIACRYHSLVVEIYGIGHNYAQGVIARADTGEVMALQHKQFHNIVGVQFHPESIFTKGGKKILRNFLEMK